jgi:hypothetical protein
MKDTVILQDDVARKSAYELSLRTHRAYRLIYFGLGVIEAFLLIRFFFKLFGANPESWFVSFVYFFSAILLFPFSGTFTRTAASGVGIQNIFEPSTLVAAAIYMLLAWGISRLLLIIRSRPLDETKE